MGHGVQGPRRGHGWRIGKCSDVPTRSPHIRNTHRQSLTCPYRVKTSGSVQDPKPRRRKTKTRARAPFIGTRPLKVTMHLRGQLVDVNVVPAVSTTTHVNYQITISRAG